MCWKFVVEAKVWADDGKFSSSQRIAGFSRPQLEPGGESPEEAHPRRHICHLGQGAIGEAIEAAGAGQFGRLHKGTLKLRDRIRYNTLLFPLLLG